MAARKRTTEEKYEAKAMKKEELESWKRTYSTFHNIADP